MEKDEYLKDDFLRELIRRSPLDAPSDDFVDRVMAGIRPAPEISVVKKPFYLYLKAATPYVIVALVIFLIVATSDLSILNWLPGKDYLLKNLVPYLGTLITLFRGAFASKYVSWTLLISCSAGMLYLVDRLFSRRASM